MCTLKSYIGGVNSLERVFVALGTNLPNRSRHLSEGRQMLKKVSSGEWLESPIYETPPVGPEGQGPYFNQVVSFLYSGTAEQMLFYLKGSEFILGRKDRGHWNSREIDLDLLYFGSQTCEGRLIVPHSQITNRQFVLVPLNDIAPNWMDPRTGLSVGNMLASLLEKEEKLSFRVITSEEP
ncbi:2-amino-4-hydroxy-6-hydroxymethyldihydropteridinediphosphokinase [Fibrobacter sp. UWEL]|nr:2-amino-4-hydroxy-6-hydroxymethyldihydropteridinediphosphokinase [Fibrobacter sp. UWEL]